MAIMKSKPTSPGRRHVVRVVSEDLHKGEPYKPLLEKQSRNGGRNNNGRITTRHVGGGHKQHYRIIDFKRTKDGIPATVERIEYDPNRTAHIALMLFADGERRYIIAPKGVKAGDVLQSGSSAPIKTGNCLPLRNIPVGSVIHGIELKPGKGAQTGTLRGCFRAVGGSRGSIRYGALALRRNAQGAGRLPRHAGRSVQFRAQPAQVGQGRRCALARCSPDGSRCCNEPGGSPPWWW